MAERIPDLAAKIALLLKVMNLSRGRVAARLEVDKSLVGRWVSGAVQPTAHNLSKLTDLARSVRPDFNLLSWERPVDEFAATLGSGREAVPTGPADPVWCFVVARTSRQEVARDGDAYPGFYHIWRYALNNSGAIVRETLMIERHGDDLLIRETDGLNEHRGHAVLSRRQLYAIMEARERQDGMYFMVLNGVGTGRALLLDGIMLTVCSIRSLPPGATTVVLQRFADVDQDAAANEHRWAAEKEEARTVLLEGRARSLIPARILRAIENRVGLARSDGEIDTVLRLPVERSISMCETDGEAMRPFGELEPAAR
jgi:transcriptional regulator with XRE-family HTH domain